MNENKTNILFYFILFYFILFYFYFILFLFYFILFYFGFLILFAINLVEIQVIVAVAAELQIKM